LPAEIEKFPSIVTEPEIAELQRTPYAILEEAIFAFILLSTYMSPVYESLPDPVEPTRIPYVRVV
jgi:hypothetical protein